jgi:hypothetical protein
MLRKSECIQVLDGVVRIKNPHHHFFAKGGRQGRQAHFDLLRRSGPNRWLRASGLDAAVLRPALFHHIHTGQQFDARRHSAQHAHWHLVDRVQHTVDAKTDHPLLTPRLQVDVAGALVVGIQRLGEPAFWAGRTDLASAKNSATQSVT